MRKLLALVLSLVVLVTVPLIALAQSASPEDQKSFFLKFVQDRLSTPERQIRISNIDGVLSSDASIDEITVSDKQGVYLKIEKAAINWNQGALFGGRLEINSLTAQSIDYIRNPVPAEGAPNLPQPEATGIEIPQLPVAVVVKQLSVPRITFGEQVFGLGSALSLDGNITLDGGSLDSSLAIKRLDGPGGALNLAASYDKASTKLGLDLTVTEPSDGIIANLLNIEGRPAIRLNVSGSGPVDDLTTQLTLDAGSTRALTGSATVDRVADGFAIDAALKGPVSTLVAPAYRDFFGPETAFAAKGQLRDSGGIALQSLSLRGGELDFTGAAATSKDGFLDRLTLKGVIANPQGGKVVLPVAGASTTIDRADISIAYGQGQNWSADVAVSGFANQTLAADTLALKASGAAENLDNPSTRRLTFNADGTLSGVTSSSPDIAAALGDSIGFGAAGLWNAGAPVQLAQFRLAGKALSLDASGKIDNGQFDGNLAVATSSLSPFSGIAGRDLAGALDLKATGTLSPLTGGFDLDVDGTGTDLRIDEPAADRILAGKVKLTGGIARTASGVSARQFRLANDQLQFEANGNFASDAADFRFDLALADIKLVSDKAEGRLAVTGTAKGEKSDIALALTASVPQGRLLTRPLTRAMLGFKGNLVDGALKGNIDGSAILGGQAVTLASALSTADGATTLTGLDFQAGGTTLSGDLTQTKAGLYQGKLQLTSANISTAAALALVDASGAANATIDLTAVDGRQGAGITATLRDVKAAGAAIGSAGVKARMSNVFGVPVIDGTIDASAVSAGGVKVTALKAAASQTGTTTGFNMTAALASGTDLAAVGSLTPLDKGYRLALDKLSLTQGNLDARLAAPAAFAVNGDAITLDNVRFDVGGGTLTATGTAGKTLDVALDIKALPLSVANAIDPGLGLAGTLNGTARITGTGSAPRASFTASGSGLSAAAIADYGITPLTFSAEGSYAGKAVTLSSFAAQSPGGLKLSARGDVPLEGRGLDIAIQGTAPLALANRFVASRGGQASGTASLSARLTGSVSAPQYSGKVSVSGATYTDPGVNVRLNAITGSATLSGQTLRIDRLTAQVATGGTVSASGSVSLAGPAYAADLTIALNHARYVDQTLFIATVSGNLTIKGPITQGATLGGALRVEKADITVPERLGGGAADIRVRHVALPKPVAQTLARAEVDTSGRPAPAARPSALRLDLTISAPNQIFIRGRGLDAEMGGQVRLTGTLDNVIPVGAFHLIRGRLSIIGQRLDFTSGTVTLTGSLDPDINLAADIVSDDLTVTVSVTGRVSDLKIDFTSNPALPQDEVLSRLLFKQGVGQLSALQLAKLAGAAAELAGGSNTSLLDSLRQSTGLDDLDLITDAQGNTSVKAGRYLEDNIYLGVEAGSNGKSKVTVNLDITNNLKASASAGTEGDSSVGVFYEQDY